MTGLALGVQPLVAYLYGGGRHRRQNIIGNMGYYTAFGLGIVLMCVSVVGHDVFPAWFNLHGNAAVLAAHGLVISSTAFVLLGVIRVAGYYYQATGKITDSSLLIYGDAFVALPCVCLRCRCGSVWTAYGWHGFPRAAVFVRLLPVVRQEKTPAVQNAAFFCPPVKFHEAQQYA